MEGGGRIYRSRFTGRVPVGEVPDAVDGDEGGVVDLRDEWRALPLQNVLVLLVGPLPEKLGLPTAKSMPTAPVGIYGPMPTAKDRP